ncbi:MAG: GTP 3',8-cyclase MoaA [Corticimicrobacter sp.]|uniref:GTP 3',8-cyclase MoaA n=1 Tax=Corticimicrobacter sp. TaxID=2678536 RepID=UPI0032DB7E2A
MSRVVIPVKDMRVPSRPSSGPAGWLPGVEVVPGAGAAAVWRDLRGRPLRDLRISVTDRCNFRCTYCMPRDVFGVDYPFMAHSDMLSFEEMARLAALFVAHGVEKIRITGGEPLMRRHVENLIALLAPLRTPDGRPVDLTLTTNGSMLVNKAQLLKDAGLQRISVSLDALDDARFAQMSDAGTPVRKVLDGIEAAARAGLDPIKINMVVRRGRNDDQILPMARYFRGSGHILRFIEFMDVGATNGWIMDEVVPGQELVDMIRAEHPLEPVAANHYGEVAERWRYIDGAGEIGVITSVSHAFCGSCTRMRLSPEGKLYLCLFADQGFDIREPLRAGVSDAELADMLAGVWGGRLDNYSERRGQEGMAERKRIEMSYIGG